MTLSGARFALLLTVSLLSFAAVAKAQSVRVTVPEENFRKEPRASSGNRLATLLEGASVRVEDRQGRWIRGSIEGWIWTESVEPTDRDGFDLAVSKPGGENLRGEPDGGARRVAVLMRGMLLDLVETRGAWTRVRRTAWVWSGSTAPTGDAPDRPVPEPSVQVPQTPERAAPLRDQVVVRSESAGLLVSPAGDTTAILRPGTDLTVLAREGGWTRVRVEGWVWEPSVMPPDSAPGDQLTPAALRNNPQQYNGRRVDWTIQYVALQRAEAVRTDFYEGEPFMLARPPGDSRGIVYIAVPPELLPAVEELRGLQIVRIAARVRTGRSALMGVPILDLIAFE